MKIYNVIYKSRFSGELLMEVDSYKDVESARAKLHELVVEDMYNYEDEIHERLPEYTLGDYIESGFMRYNKTEFHIFSYNSDDWTSFYIEETELK